MVRFRRLRSIVSGDWESLILTLPAWASFHVFQESSSEDRLSSYDLGSFFRIGDVLCPNETTWKVPRGGRQCDELREENGANRYGELFTRCFPRKFDCRSSFSSRNVGTVPPEEHPLKIRRLCLVVLSYNWNRAEGKLLNLRCVVNRRKVKAISNVNTGLLTAVKMGISILHMWILA